MNEWTVNITVGIDGDVRRISIHKVQASVKGKTEMNEGASGAGARMSEQVQRAVTSRGRPAVGK